MRFTDHRHPSTLVTSLVDRCRSGPGAPALIPHTYTHAPYGLLTIAIVKVSGAGVDPAGPGGAWPGALAAAVGGRRAAGRVGGVSLHRSLLGVWYTGCWVVGW